jgi:hypothetical protein
MKNIMDFKTAKVNLIIQGTYFLNTKGSHFKDKKEHKKKYTNKVNSIPHLHLKKMAKFSGTLIPSSSPITVPAIKMSTLSVCKVRVPVCISVI